MYSLTNTVTQPKKDLRSTVLLFWSPLPLTFLLIPWLQKADSCIIKTNFDLQNIHSVIAYSEKSSSVVFACPECLNLHWPMESEALVGRFKMSTDHSTRLTGDSFHSQLRQVKGKDKVVPVL
jgi:hypothetical protein